MITETYNLIILDSSGSMSSIYHQAITGVNETLTTIRNIGRKTDMRQLVTLTTFCGCTMKDIFHNVNVEKVKHISRKDYTPCCSTPLYDAIGKYCTRLKKEIGRREDVAVSVTIITDGYENSSKEWTAPAVKSLIDRLKKEGWLFAYIGANQDLEEVKYTIAIENTLSFEATPSGTTEMFKRRNDAQVRWSERVAQSDNLYEMRRKNADYFDDQPE